MSLHHLFYNQYSQYLFDNFKVYNGVLFDEDVDQHLSLLCEFGEVADGQSILDVGCGNGFFLNFVSSNYINSTLTGIDACAKQVSLANSYFDTNIYQHADFLLFGPQNKKYDRIFFNESIGYAQDRQREILTRYYSLLNPNGKLVVSTYRKDHVPLPPRPRKTHINKSFFSWEEANLNYRDFFTKDGYNIHDAITVAGNLEYHRIHYDLIAHHFNCTVYDGPVVYHKKWLTKRPDACYTVLAEKENLESYISFKIHA